MNNVMVRYHIQVKTGLGLKVWEERNEKNISKSPNPYVNRHVW